MANDLHAQKGTYVQSEWKDGVDDFTPMSPERMNHIEKGIQDNSEDIKKLGDSWDSASQEDVTEKITAKGSWQILNATLYHCGKLAQLSVKYSNPSDRKAPDYAENPFSIDKSILPKHEILMGSDRVIGYVLTSGSFWGKQLVTTTANDSWTVVSAPYILV